ncbi:MAG: VOC family protein [Gemmatimonadetes bacterium]|nr:VOC family protein [Gemmatimonadota bacterium]
MKIEHVALWTHDIDQSRAFYQAYFEAEANERYESARVRGFASYFLTFPGGETRLELMQLPQLSPMALPPALGYAHLAISVGSREQVDALVERARAAGVTIRSEARMTGDGYYEAVIDDPDGNPVEVTA